MFDHDSLIVTVTDVNPRSETHGDEDVPAVDVACELIRDRNLEAWDTILAELSYESEIPHPDILLPAEADILNARGQAWGKLAYVRSYAEYKVNFWIGTERIASLIHAKINKFVWCFDDEHGQMLKLRVQAEAKGDQQGPLTEIIKHRVRIETTSMQDELPLDDKQQEETEEPEGEPA